MLPTKRLLVGKARSGGNSHSLAETAEPAWHRRLRRERQHARGVLVLERARRSLAGHHGSTMPAPPPSSQQAPGKRILRGPRKPFWGCGGCGQDENWACRTACRDCGKGAPRSVVDKAREADKKAASVAKDQAPPSRRTPEADLARRLAAEERKRKELEQKIATLEKGLQSGGGLAAMDVEAEEEAEAAEPYERALRFNEKEFGPDHEETKRSRLKLEEVRRRRFEAKKPSLQMRLLEAKIGKREKAHEGLRHTANDAADVAAKAQKAVADDRVEIDKLMEELSKIKATLVTPAAAALSFASELPAELLADEAAQAELAAAETTLRAAQQAILERYRAPSQAPSGGSTPQPPASAAATAAASVPRPPPTKEELESEWEAYAAGMDEALAELSDEGKGKLKDGWLKVRQQRSSPY